MKKYLCLLIASIVIIVSCRKDDGSESKSDSKQIISLFFEKNKNKNISTVAITIDEVKKTISIEVPYGTDLTKINPTTRVSNGASINPKGTQDFTKPVIYTITAEDKTTAKYVVTASIKDPTDREILIAFCKANPNNTFGWDFKKDINAWEGIKAHSESVIYWDLSNNKLKKNPKVVEIIHELKHLKSINLDRNELKNVPKEIGSWTSLLGLEMSYNKLVSIPEEILNLTSLTDLSLDNNKLETIPPEIGKLTFLRHLILGNNNLKSIPKEISSLIHLTEFNLEDNRLTTLPQGLGKLEKLVELNLIGNQLVTLPSEISKLSRLKSLSVSNNNLETIPKEIGDLTSLTELYLEDNVLVSIPPEIGKLEKLVELNLENNKLTTLPPEISKLVNIEFLFLLNNKLKSIPKGLCDLEMKNSIFISKDFGVVCQ